MSVKIRLQRHGRKGKPFFWVVAADSRSKRDGRSLEKLGTYNPNTNPATIELDVDAAWLEEKASKVSAKEGKLAKAQEDAKKAIFEAEQAINANRKSAAEEAENEAIKAEADAKAAAEAAAKAEEAVEDDAPQTIDEAAQEAKEEEK